MKTQSYQSRTRSHAEEEADLSLDYQAETAALRDISDEDLERFLFEDEVEKPKGFLNLPTAAGLSMIVVGIAYLFQELGLWSGFDLSTLVSMLPWLGGILIILLGFGMLSWKPKRKKVRSRAATHQTIEEAIRRAQEEIRHAVHQDGPLHDAHREMHRAAGAASAAASAAATAAASRISATYGKRKLMRSSKKKIAGVCAGIAEYFNIDPTIVRILFVVGVFVSWGTVIPLYIILSLVMPDAGQPPKSEERITIIRDFQ